MVVQESKKKNQKSYIPPGFAGTGPNGSFFETAHWVDKNKPPGGTSQDKFVPPPNWLFEILSGKFFFFSPHIVWFTISLFVYFVFPYDYDSATSFDHLGWIGKRWLINTGVIFTYFGFWHITLNYLDWSSRPFNPKRNYRVSKVIHNMWYTFLGVTQFTILEALFIYCYATNRLPYVNNKTSFSNPWNIFLFLLSAFWVPLYRDFHFYFAHRFIHIKALYKYVHTVHHRNTDIEPFAGLSMHPVEHLYYFTSVGPSLVLLVSPFAFLWNAMHCLLAPAAGHSGYEDHFSADQFHYLHHRYFECNYGVPDIPFDKVFGTFRDKLKESGTTYKGYSDEKTDTKTVEIHDRKADLQGFPDLDFVIYISLNCVIWLLFAATLKGITTFKSPHTLAFLIACGPVLLAQFLANITDRSSRSIVYPFHREGLPTISFHIVVGMIVSMSPVYLLVHMVLSRPGDSLMFWL